MVKTLVRCINAESARDFLTESCVYIQIGEAHGTESQWVTLESDDRGIQIEAYAYRFKPAYKVVEPLKPEEMLGTLGTRSSPLSLPTDSTTRKGIPLCTGVLDYFPAALAEVAKLSKYGNDKHNPGEPLHHARGKSNDHADCLTRHQMDRGFIDPDTGLDHAVEVAWRALAQLQEILESRGAPMARGAKAAS